MNFISTNILWRNFNVFNNPSMHLGLLSEDDQDRSKHDGILIDRVYKYKF
jgi:hypothetical protein